MQIIRTIIWVLLLVALVVFSFANWDPTVTVKIWQGLVVDTKIPAIVIVSFAIGFCADVADLSRRQMAGEAQIQP